MNSNTQNVIKKNIAEKFLPLFYIFIIIIFIFLFFPFSKNSKEDIISVEEIVIEQENITLNYGETLKINVEVLPTNATNKEISWISSNPELVTVDSQGNIQTKKNETGTVIITATSVDGNHSKSITINIMEISGDKIVNVTGLKIEQENIVLNYGETAKINMEISPSNATNKKVTWTSSDPSLVTVDNQGNIKAVGNKNATATITVTTEDGKYKTSTKVTVKKKDTTVKVTGINVSQQKITLKYGQTTKINAEIIPSNATNNNIIWTSSDTSLVTVDNQGNVKAKSGKIGIATIELKTNDGDYSRQVDIVVVPTGEKISFSGGNYRAFMTDVVLDRKNAVMQSFAIHNNTIYISQQQSGASGAYFSKIDKSVYDNGTRKFSNNVAILVDGGHAGNIDIEVTNNVAYLWTSCGEEDLGNPSHCRIPLNSIQFGDRIKYYQDAVPFKRTGGTLVAVDDVNRTFVLMNGYWMYIYNLDDYINGNARLINKFKVNSKSRQGFDVDGNYIYVYEGIKKPILSVYTLDGKEVDRQEITKPDAVNDWEAEGVKIYNNKIYFGLAKKTDKKIVNIYILN